MKNFIRKSDIIKRQIGASFYLVPVKSGSGEMSRAYKLNETGAFIWDLLDGEHSLSQLVEKLSQEYVVPDNVENDVKEILADLFEHNLVEEC